MLLTVSCTHCGSFTLRLEEEDVPCKCSHVIAVHIDFGDLELDPVWVASDGVLCFAHGGDLLNGLDEEEDDLDEEEDDLDEDDDPSVAWDEYWAGAVFVRRFGAPDVFVRRSDEKCVVSLAEGADDDDAD
jgi:hypothetical protein